MLAINLLDNKKETIRDKVKVFFDKLKEKIDKDGEERKNYFFGENYEYLGHFKAIKEYFAGKLEEGVFAFYQKIEDGQWENLMESAVNSKIAEMQPKFLTEMEFIKIAEENGLTEAQIKKLISYKTTPFEEYAEGIMKAIEPKENLKGRIIN